MSERLRGGGKLSRSQTVVMRLDPKLKYAAELAARKQRRSLSSYIESAIELSLATQPSGLRVQGGDVDKTLSMLDLADTLWHPDEVIRFLRLQAYLPDLLTYEEQIFWEMICEMEEMWVANVGDKGKLPGNVMEIKVDVLRDKWKELKAKASQGKLEWSSLGKDSPDGASPVNQKLKTARLIGPVNRFTLHPDKIFIPSDHEGKKKSKK